MEMQGANSAKSSTTSKWLIGCGIGCGVIILGLIILGVGGYFFVRNIVEGFEESETLMDTLTERYGSIREFCPDPDGAISPNRIEAFLDVRNSMAPAMEELERSMNILSEMERKDRDKEEPSPHVFTKIKAGIGLVTLIAEFFRSRNQVLLDNGMGLGEYYFIYVVTYYSWLGKSPADGPSFQVYDQGEERRRISFGRRRFDLEDRTDFVLRRAHREVFPMLQNQYEKLVEGDVPRAKEKWRKTLKAEIEAMASDRFRLPWEDGLPEVMKSSLEPYRKRLESSYNAVLNIFEVSVEER